MINRASTPQSIVAMVGLVILSAIVAIIVVQFVPGSSQASPEVTPYPLLVTPVQDGQEAAEVRRASLSVGFPVIPPGLVPAGYKLTSVTTTMVGEDPDVDLRFMRADASGNVTGDISLEELNVRLTAPAQSANGSPDSQVDTGFAWAKVWRTEDGTAYTVFAGQRTFIIHFLRGTALNLPTLLAFIAPFQPQH